MNEVGVLNLATSNWHVPESTPESTCLAFNMTQSSKQVFLFVDRKEHRDYRRETADTEGKPCAKGFPHLISFNSQSNNLRGRYCGPYFTGEDTQAECHNHG